MFDGCRCLIPRFKDWHRVLLTWMLVSSSLLFLAWAAGWACKWAKCRLHWLLRCGLLRMMTDNADVKYSLGWVYLGPIKGARPWPSAMFVAPYDSFNKPLTTLLSRESARLSRLDDGLRVSYHANTKTTSRILLPSIPQHAGNALLVPPHAIRSDASPRTCMDRFMALLRLGRCVDLHLGSADNGTVVPL